MTTADGTPTRKAPVADPAADEQFIRSLRPKTLDECIGQTRVVEGLRISIQAAKERSESLDHVLLHGPPGLGKTTLANVIAQEMGANIVTTSGPALERGGDLMGILTNLQTGDVLFIDEIHRLSRAVEEFLYPAMEDFCVNFVIEKGAHARTLRYQLRPFTLVGATTRAGLLSSPLRERFGIFHHLDFFSVDDHGLDALDRDLLRTIATVYGGGPVGVEAIAATLNEEAQTLEEVVEPYLLKIGFLTRTPAGRRITPAALEHLDLAVGERNHAREQGQLL